MADIDLDSAIKSATTMAAVAGRAVSIWRYMDVEQGYAVSTKAPEDRATVCTCQINPDGQQFWS